MRIKSIIGNNDLSAVVRGGGHVFVVQLIGMGVAYLSQVFLARWLGVLEFGVYVYAFAWASLLSVPAAMGLPTSVMKLVSEYMALSKWGMASGVISWSRMLVISSGLFITAVAAIIINLLGGTIGNEYTSTLYVAIPIIPLIALLRVQAGIARSFGRPLLAYFPDSIVRPFLIIAGVYAFLLAGVNVTARLTMLVTMFAWTVICSYQVIMIQVRRPADLAEVEPAYESLKWLKISFPLVLVAGFKTLIARIDVIMLGIMTESSSVAVYHAASRVAVFLLLVQTAMSALSAPKIAKLFAQEKMDELQALVSGILNWVFWPTLLLAAVIVIMGHEILYMFGAGFVDGYPILLVLAVGQLVTASAGHVLQLLNMTGNQGHSARIFGWCALINILLNGALIPMYGAMGASIATAVTMLAWNLWMVTMVKRLTGINSLKLSVDRK